MRPVIADLTSICLPLDEALRRSAARAIGHSGQATPEVLAMTKAYRDDRQDEVLRETAVTTLVQLSHRAPGILTPILYLLEDTNEDFALRWTASEALGQ